MASDTVVIASADTRVTLAPAFGGRIAQFETIVAGAWTPLLFEPATPMEARDPLSWGCYVMAPWPNRIARGRFTFDGVTVDLPVGHEGHAIHGLGFTRPWEVVRADDRSCEMALNIDGAWPFGGRLRQHLEVAAGALTQSVSVESTGARFPAGVGWHPWFRRDAGGARDVRLRVAADERYELVGTIPTGRVVPVAGTHDLRGGPLLGDRRLDDCYRGVRAPIELAWDGLELRIDASANCSHAVVHTPAHAVCAEPQTCSIDAFNLHASGMDAGISVVEPGAPLAATMRWTWSPARPSYVFGSRGAGRC